MSRKNSVPSRVSQNKGVLKLSERFGCQYFSPLHDLPNWRKIWIIPNTRLPFVHISSIIKGIATYSLWGSRRVVSSGCFVTPQPDGSRRLRLIWVDNSFFNSGHFFFFRKEVTKKWKQKLSRFWSRFFPLPTHHGARRLHSIVRMQFWLTE